MVKRRFISKEAKLAILDISETLEEVPKKEWEFVLKQAKDVAMAKLAMKSLRDLYKKL